MVAASRADRRGVVEWVEAMPQTGSGARSSPTWCSRCTAAECDDGANFGDLALPGTRTQNKSEMSNEPSSCGPRARSVPLPAARPVEGMAEGCCEGFKSPQAAARQLTRKVSRG